MDILGDSNVILDIVTEDRIPLLTRDVSRYPTYFPKLKLVVPD
jgi:hypothetical protein